MPRETGDQTPELVAYLRAITRGPLLAYTVHVAVVEGSIGIAVSEGRAEKWKALVAKVGKPEAERLVSAWIEKPYKLE